MALVKNKTVIEDLFVMVAEGEPLPADRPAMVGKARYLAEREAITGRNAPLGLKLAAGEGLDGIEDDISRFTVIALDFPKYTDGRSYSIARLLRERHGYRGELRATGNVLHDQVPLMARCGFDAFDITHPGTLKAVTEGTIVDVQVHYQPAASDIRETAPAGTRPWLRVDAG